MRIGKVALLACVFGASFVGLNSAVLADEDDSKLSAAGTQVYFTPRAWFAIQGEKSFTESEAGNPEVWEDESQTLPMLGGTLRIDPQGMGGKVFSITTLYGKGSGDSQGRAAGAYFSGEQDTKRLDIEGTMQTPIGGNGAGWLIGARYVKVDADIVDGTLYDIWDNPIGDFSNKEDVKLYLAELGISTSSALDEGGKHHFFGAATLVAGLKKGKETYQDTIGNMEVDSGSGGVVGVDANAGWAYSVTPNATFSTRYRVFALSGTDFDFNKMTDIVHGPEINLTIKLGQ